VPQYIPRLIICRHHPFGLHVRRYRQVYCRTSYIIFLALSHPFLRAPMYVSAILMLLILTSLHHPTHIDILFRYVTHMCHSFTYLYIASLCTILICLLSLLMHLYENTYLLAISVHVCTLVTYLFTQLRHIPHSFTHTLYMRYWFTYFLIHVAHINMAH